MSAAPSNTASVDIGMPVAQRVAFLAPAIESVLAQTFSRWRLVVSENGEGGGAVEELVRPYLSDERISYAATGESLTMAENWTRALNLGDAPYVALLHDDDRWQPDFLAARVDALEANPDCGFAFSEWLHIDEQGREVARPPVRFAEGRLSREELADAFVRANLIVPPAVLFRRSACDAVGPSFDGRWHYCDWEMYARLAAAYPAYYLARHDNEYRRHAQTNTFAVRESPERLEEMLELIETRFEREVPGFHLSGLKRRKSRSSVFLTSASAVHLQGGWRRSGSLFGTAVKLYPPAVVRRQALGMYARSLGFRGARDAR